MRSTLANTLKNILSIFNDEHNNITAGNVILFLEIASNEGSTNTSLSFKLSVNKTTISKQLSVLKNNMKGDPLIHERIDDIDKRVKRFYLTERGKCVANTIENMFNSQNKLDSIDVSRLFEV